jgi:hypothetical protein
MTTMRDEESDKVPTQWPRHPVGAPFSGRTAAGNGGAGCGLRAAPCADVRLQSEGGALAVQRVAV